MLYDTTMRLTDPDPRVAAQYWSRLGYLAMVGMAWGAVKALTANDEDWKREFERPTEEKARYANLNGVRIPFGNGPSGLMIGLGYNMAVEPNGDVLPCQSYFEPMGNMLADPWEAIWDSALANYIRDRAWIEEKCAECPDLDICGGGCPLYAQEGEYTCRDSQNTAG